MKTVNEKKSYEEASIELIEFECKDILTSSIEFVYDDEDFVLPHKTF